MCKLIRSTFDVSVERWHRPAGLLEYAARSMATPQRLITTLLFAAVAAALASAAQAEFVYAWGSNQNGALGDGTMTTRSTPGVVTGMSSGVTAVAAASEYFSLAVKGGAAYAWGDNTAGQLGDGTNLRQLLPVPVSGLSSGVTAVAAGNKFSLAVQNGGVYAWGGNSFGQLGDGTTTAHYTPVAVIAPLTSGVSAIAAGNTFSLAVRNGGVWAWGGNDVGQLGNGSPIGFNPTSTPVAVTGLTSGVTTIAAGMSHGLAVQNGAAYAWGNNVGGQLGDGTTVNEATPIAVPGLSSGVTAIAAGKFHSLAVQNGGVYSWGSNSHGELGDGTTTAHFMPVQIDPTDLHDIIAVAAGQFSSYALSSDGSLWDWGINVFGNLGLGNFQDEYWAPQHLLPPNGYRFTSIHTDVYGADFALATLAPVPEPNCLALVAIGIASLAAYRCRRTNSPRHSFGKPRVQPGIALPAAVGMVARCSGSLIYKLRATRR